MLIYLSMSNTYLLSSLAFVLYILWSNYNDNYLQGPRQQHCELCPSKDGAIKKTDNNGWAHVVCALYIPEVRFGNVTTMEPILLQNIPPERFHKVLFQLFDV